MANTCSNTILKPYLRPHLARYAANSFRGPKSTKNQNSPALAYAHGTPEIKRARAPN
jgi:hypothetical protein